MTINYARTLGRGLAVLLVCGSAGFAHAKLPPPPAADPAKAAEAKMKAAEAAKKAGEALAKAQDRAVENYRKTKGGAMSSKPVPAVPAAKK
jgi:hypothetical protein